jgi:hypothetical protein
MPDGCHTRLSHFRQGTARPGDLNRHRARPVDPDEAWPCESGPCHNASAESYRFGALASQGPADISLVGSGAATAPIDDSGRTAILIAPLDGRARTAPEFALVAGISFHTASLHPSRLAASALSPWYGKARIAVAVATARRLHGRWKHRQ